MPVYVVLAPESARAIYATWPECQAAIRGVRGVTHQKVATREDAEAMLAGEKQEMPAGTYAFIDGNHLGGIGVHLVHKSASGTVTTKDHSTTLAEVFPGGFRLADGTHRSPADALSAIRNIAAELGAAYFAVWSVRSYTKLTIVHDYIGIGAWLRGEWKVKDPIVACLVGLIRDRIHEMHLEVTYEAVRGHQADRLRLNDWVQGNRCADALATAAIASVA